MARMEGTVLRKKRSPCAHWMERLGHDAALFTKFAELSYEPYDCAAEVARGRTQGAERRFAGRRKVVRTGISGGNDVSRVASEAGRMGAKRVKTIAAQGAPISEFVNPFDKTFLSF